MNCYPNGLSEHVQHLPAFRLGLGLSRLGTSEAVAIGAYAFALGKLDRIGDGLLSGR